MGAFPWIACFNRNPNKLTGHDRGMKRLLQVIMVLSQPEIAVALRPRMRSPVFATTSGLWAITGSLEKSNGIAADIAVRVRPGARTLASTPCDLSSTFKASPSARM